MPKLFTVGYGGRRPDDLIALLEANDIKVVIDVRRELSRAFIRPYWAGTEMKVTLASKGKTPIEYRHAYNLGNYFDRLADYQEWLSSPEGIGQLRNEAEWIQKGYDYFHKGKDVRYCLLCSEKLPYELGAGTTYDGKPVVRGANCHRFYIAAALVNLLGEEWEVKHL